MDKVTPHNWTTYLQHTMEDVLPAVYCCKGTFTNCGSYQQKRPIDDGSKSPPPPPVPGKHVSRSIHINVCPLFGARADACRMKLCKKLHQAELTS